MADVQLGVLQHTERRAAGVVDQPLAAGQVQAQRGRVPGTGDLVATAGEVDEQVHRGGEGLVVVLTEQEVVGRAKQLLGWHCADQPAQRPRELQRRRSGTDALAADVDQDHLQLLVLAQVGDEEVTGVADPVRGEHRALRLPALGQWRDPSLRLQATLEVSEQRLAERRGQRAAEPARDVQHQHPGHQELQNGHPADRRHPVRDQQRDGTGNRVHRRNHHERPEAEQNPGDEQPEEVRRQRHQVVVDQRDQQRQEDQQHQRRGQPPLSTNRAAAPRVGARSQPPSSPDSHLPRLPVGT